MKTLVLAMAGAVFIVRLANAQLVVAAPAVEAAVTTGNVHKSIFDHLKYAWEQTQWADKLATLHDSLVTLNDHLETAIAVKNAIGDPTQIVGLLDEEILGGALSESGIAETFQELGSLVQEGASTASAVQELLGSPIDLRGWQNAASLNGLSMNRFNGGTPMQKYILVENAFGKYQAVLTSGSRRTSQMRAEIRRLQNKLAGARDDAEVQKISGSINAANAALNDIDNSMQAAAEQVKITRALAENRKEAEVDAYYQAHAEALEGQLPEPDLNAPVAEMTDVLSQNGVWNY